MEYYEQPNGNVVKLHNGLDIIGVTKAFDTKKRKGTGTGRNQSSYPQ